jgi:hypothetical protein
MHPTGAPTVVLGMNSSSKEWHVARVCCVGCMINHDKHVLDICVCDLWSEVQVFEAVEIAGKQSGHHATTWIAL